MSDLQIPDVDTLGQPTGPYTQARTEWAVVIDCEIRGVAGPHHLRAAVWLARDARYTPRVICREVVETAGEWEQSL